MSSLVDLLVEATNARTLIAIGVGLVAGILLVMRTRGDDDKDELDNELTDLEERKAHAVAQLRELELQRHKMDPEAYEQQRAEQEQVAAGALRERDRLLKKPGQAASPQKGARRGAAWTVALVLFHGLMLWIISPDEIPPASAMPTEPAAQHPAPAVSPELAEVWRQLQTNPTDVDALVRGATLLAVAERLDEARQYVERALQLDPEHPGALAQYAALLASAGRAPEALARLDTLVEKHPTMVEAWSLRSLVAMQTGDMEKARDSLGVYMKLAPEGEAKEQVRAMLEKAAPAPNPQPAVDGAKLWSSMCAWCHGADGKAQTSMGRARGISDFTTPQWQQTSDDSIQRSIVRGVADAKGGELMEAFDDLSSAQVQALIAHIRAFARAQMPEPNGSGGAR
jgi:tetratricopeptide (TPR) repeat protein